MLRRVLETPWIRRVGLVLAAAVAVFLGSSGFVALRYRHRITSPEAAPEAPVALVFGAGLGRNGEPSPVLARRLDAAIALYRLGKVERLLLSGNSERYHQETRAMYRYAIERGLPKDALLEDRSGVSTYISCARAIQVYELSRALLVTQEFHLPRALFLANSLGMEAFGVSADGGQQHTLQYAVRELLSRSLAVVTVLGHLLGLVEPAGQAPER